MVVCVGRRTDVGNGRCVHVGASYVTSQNGCVRHWNDRHELVPKRAAIYIVDDDSKVIAKILSHVEMDVHNNSVTPHPVTQANNSNGLSTFHCR